MTSSRPEMLKYCIHCKLSLPRSDFGANARRRDGLQQWCRPCRREYTSVGPQAAKSRERAREYYWSHPTSVAKLELRARERLERAEKKAREELERIAFKAAKKEESRIRAAAAAKERLAAQKEKRALERAAREAEKAANPPPPYSPPKEKVCTKCGVVKLLELFPPIPHTRDGRNSWCRDCCNALSRQRGRDPDRMEKRRQYKAAARRAAGVPPRPHDAHVAAYRAHLKELARQRRAEAVLHDAHVRALTRHLKKLSNPPPRDPPGKNHRRKLKHRTGGTRQMPPWANPQTIKEVYLAARLLTEMTGITHDVDHIVPLKHPLVSGLHVESNLWPVPRDVNNRKSNKYWPDMPSPVDSTAF